MHMPSYYFKWYIELVSRILIVLLNIICKLHM